MEVKLPIAALICPWLYLLVVKKPHFFKYTHLATDIIHRKHLLRLFCYLKDVGDQKDTATVTINVEDFDNMNPFFDHSLYQASIPENQVPHHRLPFCLGVQMCFTVAVVVLENKSTFLLYSIVPLKPIFSECYDGFQRNSHRLNSWARMLLMEWLDICKIWLFFCDITKTTNSKQAAVA